VGAQLGMMMAKNIALLKSQRSGLIIGGVDRGAMGALGFPWPKTSIQGRCSAGGK
jgi:hypothetical protein